MLRLEQRRVISALILISLASGCSESNDQILQQSLARQAELNTHMARHTQQIVDTSRELVEADSKARGRLIELQVDLQDGVRIERQNLDRQREVLESERQTIARQRQRDPLIAEAIFNASILLACLIPLLLAARVLRASWAQGSDGLDELLIQELVSETPVFLSPSTLQLPLAEALQPTEASAATSQAICRGTE